MLDKDHYSVTYRRTLVPGLNREQLGELGGHTFAKWRSIRNVQPILLFRVAMTGCDVTYYIRTESENKESPEAMPKGSHVATYRNGIATFRLDTPMTAHMDKCLAEAVS